MPPPRPTAAELTALAELWNRSDVLRHHGMRVTFQPERVVVELPEVRAEHRGGLGTSAVNEMPGVCPVPAVVAVSRQALDQAQGAPGG